ncbi:MAG: hypothetical protein HXL16_02830, partial [Peptostreptococcaceae bacterium]|nr:hypothetical protein [Peptostreptococcaceae bacterium]
NMQIQKNADGSEYMSFKSDVDAPIIVEFMNGRLVITPKEEKYKKNTVVYGVFELDSKKEKILGYESKKQNGFIVGAITNGKVDARIDVLQIRRQTK